MAGQSIRRISVLTAAVAISAATAVGPTAGAQPAVRASGCPTVSIGRFLPSPVPALSWSENLAYDDHGDHGDLWVSRSLQNRVDRYDSSGRLTGSVPVASPGAVRLGPDHRMYVNSGDTTVNMVPGLPHTGAVLRFDPVAAHPSTQVFATGLGMPNGLGFDSAGRAYVADSNLGVLRLDRTGAIDQAWSARAPKNLAPSATINGTGMNGLAVIGNAVYVTMTESVTGRLLRIPIDDPAATSPAVDLTGPMPGVIDDLTPLSPSRVAVASTTGQLITANLDGTQVCSANIGVPLTSVAVTPGDPHVVVAGSETGDVLRLTLH